MIGYFYWGALTIADLQVMALGLSACLMLRCNRYVPLRGAGLNRIQTSRGTCAVLRTRHAMDPS